MECPRCQKNQRDNAQFCDRCGTPLVKQNIAQGVTPVPQAAASRPWSQIFGLLVVLVVLLLVVIAFSRKEPGLPSAPRTATVFDAQAMCEDFVTKRLKAPATAKFPPGRDNVREDIGGGTFRITSYVDSENGFGANIRSAYDCRVQHLGSDQWQLVDLQIDSY